MSIAIDYDTGRRFSVLSKRILQSSVGLVALGFFLSPMSIEDAQAACSFNVVGGSGPSTIVCTTGTDATAPAGAELVALGIMTIDPQGIVSTIDTGAALSNGAFPTLLAPTGTLYNFSMAANSGILGATGTLLTVVHSNASASQTWNIGGSIQNTTGNVISDTLSLGGTATINVLGTGTVRGSGNAITLSSLLNASTLTVDNKGKIFAGGNAITMTTGAGTGTMTVTNSNLIGDSGDRVGGLGVTMVGLTNANGSVTNTATGKIYTVGNAVNIVAGGTATVDNSGEIDSSTGTGVLTITGGNSLVTNKMDATIVSGGSGIDITSIAGTGTANNQGTITSGRSGMIVQSFGDGTANNDGGTIDAQGNGGLLNIYGGIAVVAGGAAKVTSVDGDIKTLNGPGVFSSGVTSSTVDTQGGLTESVNGPGIIAITLGSGATTIDSGEVKAGSSAFAGISLPALPVLGTLSLSGGVIGISGVGGSTVNAHGDISVASGGTFGLGAISVGGAATSHLNGNEIDPPAIGQFAIVLGGAGDATVETDGGIVDATTIGLLGVNTGTGDIIIKNDDEGTVTSDGAGLVALKFGASDNGGDSVRITNTNSIIGKGGPGMGVVALGGNNNVTIDNTGDALIRGKGDNLLNAAIGVVADGAVTITNDLNSTIDTKNGLVDGTFGINVGADKDIIVRNNNQSDIVGTAILGSVSGSVTFTNDNQSTWTSEGISVLGALGSGQYATLDNFDGSQVKITNGLLAMAADEDVEINNIFGLDINNDPLRSSIEFGGSSGNLMIAGNDARITNDGSDFKMGNFTPGIGANLMFAGNDAEIINTNTATFSMSNLVNGNYMNADHDARIKNTGSSSFTMTGINGNAMVADNDAEIMNSGGSTFTLSGISGNFMFSDNQDAKITNEKGSTFSMTGILNGNIMIAERDALIHNDKGSTFTIAGLNGNYMDAGRDARITNERGSTFTLTGLTGNLMIADRDAEIINSKGGDFSVTGVTGSYLDAGQDARIVNEKGGDFLMGGITGNALIAGRDAEIINQEGGDFQMLGITGNYLNAERDARILNQKGGDFLMTGINGAVMVADNDAEIINTKGGDMEFQGLNGQLLIADADLSGVGKVRVENSKNSTLTFRGVTGGGNVSGQSIEFVNDDSSVMNFIGLNGFLFLSPGTTSFDNDGLVNVFGTTSFVGLQDFYNHGAVSMQDGDTTDNLLLGGNYEAQSDLYIDAYLTPGGTADFMGVGVFGVDGNTSGTTHVMVDDLDGNPGQYDPNGVLFAVVTGTTDPSHFTTDGGIDKGLYRYDTYLRPDTNTLSGENEWYLANTLDQEAYEFPIMMAGAQALWNETTGVWLDRTADLRSVLGEGAVDPSCAKDCMAETGNVTPGVWMKALGGTASRDVSNSSGPPPGMLGTTYSYNNSYDQDYLGFVIGADGGKEWTTESGQNAAWLAGVLGGYSGSNLDFDHSNTNVDYSAFSLGVYTTYLQGGFFIDATFKADFGTMDYDSNVGGGFSDDDSASFTSVGGVIDTGYRFGLGTSAFFEPQASLSYVHTSIDDISVLGTDVSFDDGESLLGRLGARLGASMDGTTMRSEFFVQASVYDEFMGDYDANLASNGLDPSTSFDASGVYGEVGVGANVFGIGSSWNGFVTGNVQFGDDEYLGYNGNVGMRYSW